MNNIINSLRQELKALGNSEIARTKDRFFKEEVKHYGIMNSELIKIAKKYFKQIKDMSKSDIFGLCEELFASGYMEECIIACNWSYSIHKTYEKSDFKILKSDLRVNIIGYSKDGIDSEDDILIKKTDIQDIYSIDNNKTKFRAEFY